METEAENNGSSQQADLDKVLEKINEIAKKSADGNYIYRGEPECYDKVSSSLYRESPPVNRTEIGIAYTQQAILEEAKVYIGQTDDIDETDDIGLLTELQHFGGKTNLIDFTADFLIALFFACDGSHEEDGRVILLKNEEESDDYRIASPRRITPRVESQKSVFVDSPTGFVEPDNLVTIPADLKFPILDYLNKHHRISIATIYNDLHGFIQRSAHTEFLKALTCQRKASETENREEKLDLYKNAIIHHTEAIKLKSNYYAAYYNRGVAYYDIGKFDAAIDDLNKLRDFPYKDANFYNVFGLVYAGKMDFEAAIEDFNKAIAIDPEDASAYNNRGNAYAGTGDFGAAIEDFSKAIDLDPEDAGAYNNRGNAYYGKGELDKAIQDHSKSIDLDPKDASAYNNRGNAYDDIGDFGAAIEDFNKAIDLNSEDFRFYSNRGVAYGKTGDFGAAIEDFNKVMDLVPENAGAYNGRGVAYSNIGDFDLAIEDFNKAIALNPEDANGYSNRGNAYARKMDFDLAIEDFNKAIALNPENANVYNNRGVAYNDIGKFDLAIEDFNKAMALNPENALFYGGRGVAYGNIGDFDLAIEDFNKAIALNPGDARFYNSRGVAWLILKKWQKAKADLTTAKNMGCDIIESFHNEYESVEDFEATNGVTLPKDIAALLSGNKVNDTGQKRNEQYWAAFFEELPSDQLGLKIPSIYDSHYRDLHMGITGCYIRVSQRVKPAGIAAAFVMKRSAQDFLHSLIKQQTAIENELGEKFYCYEVIQGEKQLYLELKPCDVTDTTDWSDQHQWFAMKLEKLVEVFRPRIEKLI